MASIYACVNNYNGNIRIVDASTTCRPDEYLLSWNQTGPQGPTGAQGPQGPQGIPGPELIITSFDKFDRPDQAGWGIATDGEPWSVKFSTGNIPISLSIASHAGVVSGTTGDTIIQLGSDASVDGKALLKFLPGLSGTDGTRYCGIAFREVDAGGVVQQLIAARMYIIRDNNGNIVAHPSIENAINSVYGPGGLDGTPVNSNTSSLIPWWMRVHVMNATLYMNVWPNNMSEPQGWNTVVDLSNPSVYYGGSGAVGVYTNISSQGQNPPTAVYQFSFIALPGLEP